MRECFNLTIEILNLSHKYIIVLKIEKENMI